MEKRYTINPAYIFRNDERRVILTNNRSGILEGMDDKQFLKGFSWHIHPYIAFIFSFFNGKRTAEEVHEILKNEYHFSIPKDEFCKSILSFVNNKDTAVIPIQTESYTPLPLNFLTEVTDESQCRDNLLKNIDIDRMYASLDLKTMRQYIPNECTLMLNDTCCTNCIYCYADRSHQVRNLLPFDRIKEILHEADELGFQDIGIDGGDFLLYPHWSELLMELRSLNYEPSISTKFPITEEIVEKLQAAKIRKIQLSLDSVDKEEIMQILKVDAGYLDRVKKGVALLNDAGIEITFKPVITRYNDSLESVENLIRFASQFEKVKTINLTPADYSQFKPFNYHSTRTNLRIIQDKVPDWEQRYGKEITMLGYSNKGKIDDKQKEFPKRNVCAGNVSSFFMLPDGKVTLCEQLYWHPFFILGDLNRQSIMEMWQSEKALSLWNFSQDEVRDCSPCKTCSEFEECRRGQGNCWRIAVSTYGTENYDFPAPNCPKAPEEPDNIFIPE